MIAYSLRKANQKEINFYEQVLYPFQDEIFKLFHSDHFYLSGGTCLSRFYYQHRYSEDLDFFYDGYLFPKEEFNIQFQDVVNRISDNFQIELAVNGDYFKRIFIEKDDVILKTEFIFENYKNIGQRININGIQIDSKENIATNKLTAIYDRKTIKDFFDLYFLLQDVDFDSVVKWAKYKVVPLDYEGTLIALAASRLEGTVLACRAIHKTEIDGFIEQLVQRLINHAKSI